MTQALAFPPPAQPPWLETQSLARAGLDVRSASGSDLPFLQGLYAQSRAMELARAPWPDTVKRAFCDSQFALQHRHYVGRDASAFLIVLRDGRPIGRLYLHWTSAELRVVDLLLDATTQGQGIGSTLLRWVQAIATSAGYGVVSLHVADHNDRAYDLYRRLGFDAVETVEGGHRRMVWRAPAAALRVS